MVDVDNCGHLVSQRNSKVESFLHRHPHLGFTRYYETCVVEWKGSLLPRNIIIADHSLILTQNPPKLVLLSIHLKHINNIQVVADRHLVLNGGTDKRRADRPLMCQHVELIYSGGRRELESGGGSGCSSPTSSPSLIGSNELHHHTTRLSLLAATFFPKSSQPSSPAALEEEQPQVLNLYLYQPNSLLLNELFLMWRRHELQLKDEDGRRSRSRRAAEKVLAQLSRTCPPSSPGPVLPYLATLHKALIQYQHLPRISWKDWHLITKLHKLLEKCVQTSEPEKEDRFQDRVSSVAFLFDIFRLLYQATNSSWLTTSSANNQTVSQDNNSPTNLHQLNSSLVQLIFCSSSNTLLRSKVIETIVCNPRTFTQRLWVHTPESRRVKLVAMTHNASVALLHEIVSIVHFSSKDKQRAKFMSCLQHSQMESYLKQSMTQVVHLLWPNGRQLGASQTALLYRHVSIAQTLINSVPSAKMFLHQHFCEEFRYFVPEESGEQKILDRYPLKPKLLKMCHKLRQQITEK